MKSMNKILCVKILSIFILMFCVFTLVACGNEPSKKLWDKYVKSVNNQDINGVAECFTEPETKARDNFLTDYADYFNGLHSLKTVKYNETINCSFSNAMNTQAYYLAEVEVLVNGSTTYNITIYSYENNKGLFFCSYFNFEDGFTGNEPNGYWTDKTYFHTDEFLYKDYPTGAVYIEETKNLRKAVVPAEVDGNKLTTIGEYAFYKYYKMLSFTIPTSKLRELIIEEGVTTIGKYAFYQCNKLNSVVIPESMRYIDRMAFANCSRLERLEFQTRTKESGSQLEIESASFGKHNGDELVIKGAHNLQTGEIIYLNAELGDNTVPRVEWSTSSEVLTVNASTGKIVANKQGRAKVVATLVENRAVTAEVEIVITEIESKDCLKMYWDAFSRCPNLKEIYLHAYNPNSFVIDSGSNWLFNSTCKIYVPKGSRDMYVSHALWSKYADQIVEMEEDDSENTIDIALQAVNLTKETADEIYSSVNPNKIDNIIYLIKNGSEYKLVNAYVGSILLDNASASIIEETTSQEKLYDLFDGLLGGLSEALDESDILNKIFENHISKDLAKLDKIFDEYKQEDYTEENYQSLERMKNAAIIAISKSAKEADADKKLLEAWQNSYNVLKIGETEKAEKDFNIDDIAITLDDTEDVKNINSSKTILFNELVKKVPDLTMDKVAIEELEIVENDLNPGVKIYRMLYKDVTGDGGEETITVLVKNDVVTIIDENYADIYNLIKVIMASGKVVETK
ncbi:MAG: leucine-rich repeat domain-containing protein [Bacilli bacterium]|nr:leucine-rich repeat domain-containing protein [Bacilli bacterium]